MQFNVINSTRGTNVIFYKVPFLYERSNLSISIVELSRIMFMYAVLRIFAVRTMPNIMITGTCRWWCIDVIVLFCI
jgi:hypothetical protein